MNLYLQYAINNCTALSITIKGNVKSDTFFNIQTCIDVVSLSFSHNDKFDFH